MKPWRSWRKVASVGTQQDRFQSLASDKLEQNMSKIRTSVGLLSEDDLWWRPDPSCNSVGNLMLHLCGNLSQWLLQAMGELPFDRYRDEEFRAEGGWSKRELLSRLEAVVGASRAVVEGLDQGDLEAAKRIQVYDTDGLGAVFGAVEHMSYHTGQIVYVAKELRGREGGIDFYPHLRDEP
jgi:hypothetical protein